MPTPSALHALARAAPPWQRGQPVLARSRLALGAIGYGVPRDFAGRVHSVFAQACNIVCGEALFTLVGPAAGRGPTLLCIAGATLPDLRQLFEVDEPVHCERRMLRSARAELDASHARVWWPAPPRARLSPALLDDGLRRAAELLAARRRHCPSVIDRQAAACAGALTAACSDLDARGVALHAEQLIGWGEGLTPAGDDFVVGLCAGLDASIDGNARRRACRDALGSAMRAASGRTTTISAHYLRLAAGGHYQERLLAARDALLGNGSWLRVGHALRAACAVGASSGTDTLTGLLAALTAWPVAEALC